VSLKPAAADKDSELAARFPCLRKNIVNGLLPGGTAAVLGNHRCLRKVHSKRIYSLWSSCGITMLHVLSLDDLRCLLGVIKSKVRQALTGRPHTFRTLIAVVCITQRVWVNCYTITSVAQRTASARSAAMTQSSHAEGHGGRRAVMHTTLRRNSCEGTCQPLFHLRYHQVSSVY
jgi:hypothetical protein